MSRARAPVALPAQAVETARVAQSRCGLPAAILLVALAMLISGCSSARGDGVHRATSPASLDGEHGAADADGLPAELAWEPLFTGDSLSGWVPVNAGPDTWRVRDGVVLCSGRPTGVLRSPRQHENFVLELEWCHLQPGGNAGLFVWSDPLPARGQPFTRSIEVQVLDGTETENYTSHGDVFSIHGARLTPDRPHPAGWERCLPSARRALPSPAWNHYRLVARDGTLTLAVNGEVVSSVRDSLPRKGYLCLEAEGSEVHFRGVRLAELPPSATPLAPEYVAPEALPFRSLFDGTLLAGWSDAARAAAHWSAQDWTLNSDGRGAPLFTDGAWGDIELIADWCWTGSVADARVPLALRGVVSPQLPEPVAPGAWQRVRLTLRGQHMTLEHNGRELMRDALQKDLPLTGPLALLDFGQPVRFANLYLREL